MHSIHPTSADLPTDRLLEVDKQINTPSNQLLGVRIYSHRRAVLDAGSMPLVVHFHGGAFVAGSLDTGTCVARLLAQAGAVVISLDYPLAPAQPFPLAVEAGYAALVWAWKARHKLVGRSTSLFVAGEEAGGNLAAAVALMARDRQQPVLAGQILLSPMLDPILATASLRCVNAGRVGCPWADGWRQYLSRLEQACHPYAAPGNAMRLSGLPPTLLLTAQDDPLRDEAQAYANRLGAAGRAVQAVVLPGPTGWPASYRQATSQQATWGAAVQQQFSDFFHSFLGAAEVDSSRKPVCSLPISVS
ncbi:alpha/beta hydrolase [Rhodoferax fermentans]|uniref:alpha/beta hydrolase n=1 Tax=Rhodoferax fermentans TaxID=28066 RepID=UPI0009924D15|nr:alpha/beta hydrolase [Rhodoferax fermentans]MBK1684659.1 alpha/beta hydrolase [Rhodoferax fermentans]